jgi:AcrR family transcriptional regulator
MLAERGYNNVTIAEICADAGVSQSTFYRRFGTKEGVVLAPIDERVQFIVRAIETQPPGTKPAAMVLGAFATMAATRNPDDFLGLKPILVDEDPPAIRRHLNLTVADLESDVARLLAERYGYDPDDMVIQSCAGWIAATVRQVSRKVVELDGEFDFFEELGATVSALANGLEYTLANYPAPHG